MLDEIKSTFLGGSHHHSGLAGRSVVLVEEHLSCQLLMLSLPDFGIVGSRNSVINVQVVHLQQSFCIPEN